MGNDVLLEVKNLTKLYTRGYIKVSYKIGCRNVSFSVRRGEVLGLLGQSGSGKTTVANVILRLIKPTSGAVYLEGKDIFSYHLKDYYAKVQQIFQDPYGSFNYFYRVDRTLHKAVSFKNPRISRLERNQRIAEALEVVGLNPSEILGRYPHQLSGGQLQRILIARVLLIEPQLVVADEPTSMIDASSRAGILNHLLDLKEYKIAIIFITHDVGQAAYISDTVVVMHEGEVVEQGEARKVLFAPEHPYTQRLLSDVPKLHEKWDLSQDILPGQAVPHNY